MNLSSSILFLFFMSAFLFSNLNEVGEVYKVTGDVIIKPTRENILPNIAISGRTLYNGDLIFILSDPLPVRSSISIDGIEISFSQIETEVDETYLEVDVNQFLNSGITNADAQMTDNNHIRIGNPLINVDSNQIFIRSEAETLSDALIMDDIIIEEGTVPVMNPQDDIIIHMPGNLEIVLPQFQMKQLL